MKSSKAIGWLSTVLTLFLLATLTKAQPTPPDKKDKSKAPPSKSNPGGPPYGGQGTKPAGPGPGTYPSAPGRPSSTLPDKSGKPADKPGMQDEKSGNLTDKSGKESDRPASATEKSGTQTDKSGAHPEKPGLSEKSGTQSEKPIKPAPSTASAPKPQLTAKPTSNGGYVKTAPSGAIREKMESKPDGQHVQQLTPTGRVEKEVVQKTDGSQHTIHYAPSGRVAQEEVVNKDGTKAVTSHQVGRGGVERAQETVKYNAEGKAVSKTVIVNNTTIVKNTTIVNNTTVINNRVERNYVVGHYGYVYQPAYVVYRPYVVSWYDPFWYPGGVLVVHPFHFVWGWETAPWYHYYYGPYWSAYPVYPTPAYWVTDWMVAGYVADHYAASVSAAQAQDEARQAHEEAQKAREAADRARDEAEIAEARRAAAEAELRATRAEERASCAERMEASAGKPVPTATPIDKETKEQLKTQIEATIAEKKELTEQSEKAGHPVLPDLSRTLADPKHVYPVSKTTSVILAKDSSPAGAISEGDLLRIEPGQENVLKEANENTFVTMRVLTSKGEEGEVTAGTLISVPLKDVQEFDNEFRAKLDLGLAEADKNKEAFKKGS